MKAKCALCEQVKEIAVLTFLEGPICTECLELIKEEQRQEDES